MPIKKWLIQYAIALPTLFLLLAGVQLIKGRALDYAIEFGMLWSVLSLSVFALTRAINYKRGLYCRVCNDLPSKQD